VRYCCCCRFCTVTVTILSPCLHVFYITTFHYYNSGLVQFNTLLVQFSYICNVRQCRGCRFCTFTVATLSSCLHVFYMKLPAYSKPHKDIVVSDCSRFTLCNNIFKAHVYLLNKLDKSKQLQITVLVHCRHSQPRGGTGSCLCWFPISSPGSSCLARNDCSRR